MNYVINCSSTADLSLDWHRKRDLPFVSFHYQIDGKEYPDDLGQSMSFQDFFQKIREGAMPTTSQVNVGQYMEFFEEFLKEGKDILHITLSSGISGSYQSACMARLELAERYPGRRIEIVDSLGASSGYGMLVDDCLDLRDAGKSLDEVLAYAEGNKLNIHHWFFSSDLSHYVRGGRISATKGWIGSLLQLCPLMNMDDSGHLIPRQKIRKKSNAMKEMIEEMKHNAQDGLDYSGKVFMSHSDCYEDAKAVADMIEENFPNIQKPIVINSVGTVIGAHTGPGTVALFFHGQPRTP